MPARPTSIPPNYILVLWLLMYFGARLLLKQAGLGTGLRIGIALAPVPVFAAFLWQAIRSGGSTSRHWRWRIPWPWCC